MKKMVSILFVAFALTNTQALCMNQSFVCCRDSRHSHLFHSVTDEGNTRIFDVKYATFLWSILFNEFIDLLSEQRTEEIVLKFFTKNYQLTISFHQDYLGKFIDCFACARKEIKDLTLFSMRFDCITDLLVAKKSFVFSQLEYLLTDKKLDGEITVKLIEPHKKNKVAPWPIVLPEIPKKKFPKKKQLAPLRTKLKPLKSTANVLAAEGKELRRTKSNLK